MFLNAKHFILVKILFLGLTAQAEIKFVQPGQYELISGPKKSCANFVLSAKDLVENTISLSGKYTYKFQNSASVLESDLDPTCEFREENQRQVGGNSELALTRVNEEVCSGKSVSRTSSTATFRPHEIEIHHDIEGSEPYTCLWKKK